MPPVQKGRLVGPLPIFNVCVQADCLYNTWHYDWYDEQSLILPDSQHRLMLGWWIKGSKYPAALCILSTSNSQLYGDLSAIYIELFECHPKYRGTGLAEACVNSLLDVYPGENFLLDSVPRAVNFWRRLGFKTRWDHLGLDTDLRFREVGGQRLDIDRVHPPFCGEAHSIAQFNEHQKYLRSLDRQASKQYKLSQGEQVAHQGV